jgi:hypothetical protein
VADSGARGARGLAPLLLGCGVVVLVSLGQARGLWLANLHNGLLGLAFTFVGTYVLFQRPAHREGRLFMATGALEALLFFGRQMGHFPPSSAARWWGWVGVWPTGLALALTTMSVLCFPDGRLPSHAWRWVVAAVVALAATCAALSAWWPVEYSSTGMRTPHPINAVASGLGPAAWSAVAHPAYAAHRRHHLRQARPARRRRDQPPGAGRARVHADRALNRAAVARPRRQKATTRSAAAAA